MSRNTPGLTDYEGVDVSDATADRFWSHVDRSGGPDACWPWTAGRQKGKWQYGVFHPVKGRTVRAHRLSLEMSLGRSLLTGMQARHTCDNPPCVNPTHLVEGTNAQNVADMVSRDRQARGEGKGRLAKLNDATVLLVRHRVAAGEQIRSVAAELEVAETLISMIVRGKRWSHLGGPRTFRYRKVEAVGK